MPSCVPLFSPSVKHANREIVTLPLTHLGQYRQEIEMSKGSKARPFSVSQNIFANNFDAIFRKPDPRVRDDVEHEDEEFNRINAMQVRVKEDADKVGQCGCGRSPTGKCIGWHGLTEEAFKEKLEEYKLNEGK
jgi:hypothetical protein